MRYQIKGLPFPVVEIQMNRGEHIITDSGAMAWMDPGINMETVSKGGIGGAFGRMFSGETVFQNRYIATRDASITLASSFPGEIRHLRIEPGKEIILQKSAFLCSQESVDRKVYLQKKLSTAIFGGEGFVMSRYFGQGDLFIEIDGSAIEYDLAAGQQLIVDTGYVVAMDATCKMEITEVKGMANKFLGGEGLFNTLVTGPGHVILQTMPLSALAGLLTVNSGS